MAEANLCRLTAELHLMSTREGGRSTAIGTGGIYRPEFMLDSAGRGCRIDSMERETMSPGESGRVEMTLTYPVDLGSALRIGARFQIREGNRVVGWGTVLNIRKY